VGLWLTVLHEPERSQTAPSATDKTDRTARDEVFSVPVGRVCENSGSQLTECFVGAPCGSGHDQQPSPTPPDLSPEDWWAFFDERAAIREFDGKTLRAEAEARALQDTAVALGARPSDT
jgi:hypothetical protein